jgi:hypothetical protein
MSPAAKAELSSLKNNCGRKDVGRKTLINNMRLT